MGVAAMELAITDRLKTAFPKCVVDQFPDDFDDYSKLPINRGACILVAYRDGRFGESRTHDLVVQEHFANFEVQVVTKSLRGAQGAVLLLDAIRANLTGYRADNAEPLRPVSEQFVSGGGGRWVYAQLYACTRPHVEDRDEETAELDHSEFFNTNESNEEAWLVDITTDPPTATETTWHAPEEEP